MKKQTVIPGTLPEADSELDEALAAYRDARAAAGRAQEALRLAQAALVARMLENRQASYQARLSEAYAFVKLNVPTRCSILSVRWAKL